MTRPENGPSLVLVVVVGVLVAAGVILLLERSLTRVLLGVILISNGVNVLILLSGAAGGAPLVGTTPAAEMSDPLAQAMILTAIVITLGLAAFLLAVAYRSWLLTTHDEVRDDPEDRQIVGLADRDAPSVADLGGEGPGNDPEQVDRPPAGHRSTEPGGPGGGRPAGPGAPGGPGGGDDAGGRRPGERG